MGIDPRQRQARQDEFEDEIEEESEEEEGSEDEEENDEEGNGKESSEEEEQEEEESQDLDEGPPTTHKDQHDGAALEAPGTIAQNMNLVPPTPPVQPTGTMNMSGLFERFQRLRPPTFTGTH
ncbi:uncharacterized protein LOC131249634 [Magnolia sinica]|uniref:uncharacterized protein LOC131249634 n=1 Tax=Magnolia sinica TaxID=86752 RepID=UPI00265B51A0|nr:uncharacterized protein LOC131249634 [Magnolia sinica]